jgi:hypothetical protein
MTHVEGIYNPSTDDFPGHYGWPALMDLPPEQAIMNGDNYGFYANGTASFLSSFTVPSLTLYIAIYTNDLGC